MKSKTLRLTKRESWDSMDEKTQSFVRAMAKEGLTVRAIKTKSGIWRK